MLKEPFLRISSVDSTTGKVLYERGCNFYRSTIFLPRIAGDKPMYDKGANMRGQYREAK
jgi:hypothetical protein